MSEEPKRDQLLALLDEGARRRHVAPLSEDDVVAYALGELSTEAAARVRDLLPFDETAQRLLMDLAALEDPLEPGSPADLSEAELERHRERLAERIKNSKLDATPSLPFIPRREPLAPTSPTPFAASESWRLERRARWATRAAVAASLGLLFCGGWAVERQARLRARSIEVLSPDSVTLSSRATPRGGPDELAPREIVIAGARIELRLALPPQSAPDGYDLQILSTAEHARPIRRFSGRRPHKGDVLVLLIDRGALDAGDYEIRVTPTGRDGFALIYALRIPP